MAPLTAMRRICLEKGQLDSRTLGTFRSLLYFVLVAMMAVQGGDTSSSVTKGNADKGSRVLVPIHHSIGCRHP